MLSRFSHILAVTSVLSIVSGAPLTPNVDTEAQIEHHESKKETGTNEPGTLLKILEEMTRKTDLNSQTTDQNQDGLPAFVPHALHKRQATRLAMNFYSPPDTSSGGMGTLGLTHTLTGGGGTGASSFGGQLGVSTDGQTSWGLNAGHNTGSTNYGANVGGNFGGSTNWGANAGGSFGEGLNWAADAGGEFGGSTNWGANVGGTFGEGLDWSADAGGEFGGNTNWGVNLDKTWEHQGGSSSSLGGWVKGGQGDPSFGVKYVHNL